MDLKCKSKPEKFSKVLPTFNTLVFILIALQGSKTESDELSLRPFWNVLAVTNEAENAPYITTKI